MSKKKIFILGGTGFVGSVLRAALKKDFKIYAHSRKTGLNILDFSNYKKKLLKINPDIILNCAAHVGSVHYGITKQADILIDNLQLMINLYKGLLFLKRKVMVINFLANCSYDGNTLVQKEEDWLKGLPHETAFSFGSSRRMLYKISKVYNQQYQIKTYNLILPGLYGPGDHKDLEKVHALDGIIIRMLLKIKEGINKFEIWGSGKPIREWCYIFDLARIVKKIINSKKEKIYPINIAQNKGYSIKEIAQIVSKTLNYNFNFIYNKKFQDGAKKKILSNKNFKKEFPNFKFTAIHKGIKATIEYYKKIL